MGTGLTKLEGEYGAVKKVYLSNGDVKFKIIICKVLDADMVILGTGM